MLLQNVDASDSPAVDTVFDLSKNLIDSFNFLTLSLAESAALLKRLYSCSFPKEHASAAFLE